MQRFYTQKMDTTKLRLSGLMELIWWIMTALVVVVILFPVFENVPEYPFWTYNILYITLFITYTRYIFHLKHTWLARLFWLKIIFIFTSIPVTFLLIEGINSFQVYLDEVGINDFLGHLSNVQQQSLATYIRTEMIFFGTAAVIGSILWPIRLIISIWRVRNRGTV